MMLLVIAGVVVAALLSLFFSTLTYSLRDVSRSRLAEYLERHGKSALFAPTMQHQGDLIFLTAFARLLANMFVLVEMLMLFEGARQTPPWHYLLAVLATGVITLFSSVAIPHAAAKHFGSELVGIFASSLQGMRMVLLPATKIMHAIEAMMRRATGSTGEPEADEIEKEILSAVEEGEKEGVVDEEEREMIERVIAFGDTHVGQIMTSRPEIAAIPQTASLSQVKQALQESGHSRIPVYDRTLDTIVGVLYARDLLKQLGVPADQFDLRKAMRPPLYVPETKPLRDLLHDFQLQKVHIAIVMDEYGGTAGLVTIEDLLEELVGDISDEHEPQEPAMLKRLNENAAEADARIYLDELNRLMALDLPEDAGYDTLGGFVSTTLGRIPETGAVFEQNGLRFTVLDAEPRKVNRVKIEVLLQPVEAGAEARNR
jgi:CBS domain containing-hemolysin-like protein